ncbi:MAG: dephospho-CoA kinase [Clostridiales bacterium]|nr:dephospho-CoA kinase [Clostridiales bacterium]
MIQNSPYIIGLTGGIASGKTNISRALRQRGAVVIDTDEISRALTADGGKALGAIRDMFGDAVFDGDSLSRQRLAAMVFGHQKLLQQLNGIMHPLIGCEVKELIQQHQGETALLVEVPLLFEVGWNQSCDEVWCVYAPARVQVHRLRKRDKLPLSQAIRRINSQMSGRERCRRSDYCIDTTGTREQSAAKALILWRSALRRAALV